MNRTEYSYTQWRVFAFVSNYLLIYYPLLLWCSLSFANSDLFPLLQSQGRKAEKESVVSVISCVRYKYLHFQSIHVILLDTSRYQLGVSFRYKLIKSSPPSKTLFSSRGIKLIIALYPFIWSDTGKRIPQTTSNYPHLLTINLWSLSSDTISTTARQGS